MMPTESQVWLHFVKVDPYIANCNICAKNVGRYYDNPELEQIGGRGYLLSQQVLETWVQLDVVFAQVPKQLVCSQHFGNSHQLWNEEQVHRFQEQVDLHCTLLHCGALFLRGVSLIPKI